MGRIGIPASAAVGRERENPRSERSEPAALKVQLREVGFRGEGACFAEAGLRIWIPVKMCDYQIIES